MKQTAHEQQERQHKQGEWWCKDWQKQQQNQQCENQQAMTSDKNELRHDERQHPQVIRNLMYSIAMIRKIMYSKNEKISVLGMCY